MNTMKTKELLRLTEVGKAYKMYKKKSQIVKDFFRENKRNAYTENWVLKNITRH